MVSERIEKILSAQEFKIGNLSQKLFSLKYFSYCKKKLGRVSLYVLHIFLHVGFCLSKLDFEKCVLIICILREGVQHRVGRVLSVSPVVGIGTPPPL